MSKNLKDKFPLALIYLGLWFIAMTLINGLLGFVRGRESAKHRQQIQQQYRNNHPD